MANNHQDEELWWEDGDCLVHLYAYGQSRRGPAFRIPFDALLLANCEPLLDRHLVEASSLSNHSFYHAAEYRRGESGFYELYIPAPPSAERAKAMFYHIATRNFFAWLMGKPLVGNHLGGALVNLLNSMTDYRGSLSNNEQDILDYMDQEGYADMRNQPDYALAILYFADHFHFKNIWIDAYAHCAGMYEHLNKSIEYEVSRRTLFRRIMTYGKQHISPVSSEMIRIGRFEMDDSLERCGKSLATFLEEELSPCHLGLTPGGREHLERFRSFLQGFYVEKFGYYPPTSPFSKLKAFPREAYEVMANEFGHLYDFLVDETFVPGNNSPVAAQGGLCVLQSVQSFNERHFYKPLPHPLPLLPEAIAEAPKPMGHRISDAVKPISRRLSLMTNIKADKNKLDTRLVTLNSLAKASNRRKTELLRCPLVRAYRIFETDCVFPNVTADKKTHLSLADARKVRWILIYAMLQTLLCATKIPDEVRDVDAVPYCLYVSTAGCPPWQKSVSSVSGGHTRTDSTPSEWGNSSAELSTPYTESLVTPSTIEPDVDYFSIKHSVSRSGSSATDSPTSKRPAIPRKDSKRKSILGNALATPSNMPEILHPRPIRRSFADVLDRNYGEKIEALPPRLATPDFGDSLRRDSTESTNSSQAYTDILNSPTWSQDDYEVNQVSPPSSVSGSEDFEPSPKRTKLRESILGDLPALLRQTSSSYSVNSVPLESKRDSLMPEPLRVPGKRKAKEVVGSKRDGVQYETIEGIALACDALKLV